MTVGLKDPASERPALSVEETEAAFQAMMAALPPEDGLRLERITAEGEKANDADSCWTYRTMIRAAFQVDPAHQRTIARAFVTP